MLPLSGVITTDAPDAVSALNCISQGEGHRSFPAVADIYWITGTVSAPQWSPDALLETYLRGPDGFAPLLPDHLSIVLWDIRRRSLVLVRAPLASPALFYSQAGHRITFADSPRRLLAVSNRQPQPDEEGLRFWLQSRPHSGSHTLFADICRVLPGTVVTIRDGRVQQRTTWSPLQTSAPTQAGAGEYASQLHTVLQEAVVRCLPQNAVIGAELSGGLDSSSVTVLAADALQPQGRTLHAFTGVPGDGPVEVRVGRFADEGPLAANVAATRPNIQHHLAPQQYRDMLRLTDLWSDAEEAPALNPHHFAWLESVYEAAHASGVQTLLSGGLGNSTISYTGEWALVQMVRHHRYREALQLAAGYRSSRTPGTYTDRTLLRLAICGLHPLLARSIQDVRKRRSARQRHIAARPEFTGQHSVLRNHDDPRAERLLQLQQIDTSMTYLAIRRRFGMAVMDPTADRKVVEFCLDVPEEYFCQKGRPRSLIRDAMQGEVPDSVRLQVQRGTQGAGVLNLYLQQQAAYVQEFARLRDLPLLRRALNLELLMERAAWPRERILAMGWHPYLTQMARFASLGRFFRRMHEGTLFETLPFQQG